MDKYKDTPKEGMKPYSRVAVVFARPEYRPGLRHEGDVGRLNLKGDGYKVIDEDGDEFWLDKETFENFYSEIKLVEDKIKFDGEGAEYKTRVYNEAVELTKKINKLQGFMNINSSPEFVKLDKDEIYRLRRQLITMKHYLAILVERINEF